MDDLLKDALSFLEKLGYPGVVLFMFIESSFIPFPSEVVIPPAGYLASKGRMELWGVIASGTLGSLLGALFNYVLAAKLGRPFLERYGARLFIKRETLAKADRFFQKHGHISTFVGRLLPAIRQYISLPAGLTRMPLGTFCLFTSFGAGLWVMVLAFLGYWVGENEDLLKAHLQEATLGLVGLAFTVASIYWLFTRSHKQSP